MNAAKAARWMGVWAVGLLGSGCADEAVEQVVCSCLGGDLHAVYYEDPETWDSGGDPSSRVAELEQLHIALCQITEPEDCGCSCAVAEDS